MWLRKSRKEPVLSHISMKNLPESERPYERFQILGAEALSDAELLAIILKTGTKDYTALDLARDLLSECQGNLLNLYEIGYEQLLERRGIGPVKATQLKAIAELSKRIARTGRGYHLSMNCPSSIADYYMEELRHRREEAFMAAFFDSKCKFLGDSVIVCCLFCVLKTPPAQEHMGMAIVGFAIRIVCCPGPYICNCPH